MKVQLVSYRQVVYDDPDKKKDPRPNMPSKRKLELNIDLYNKSEADIIIFPGWSFDETMDIKSFEKKLTNKKTIGIFDMKNTLFIVNGGICKEKSNQLFAKAKDKKNNETVCNEFLTKLENNHLIKIGKYKIRILQCGEISILENQQREHNTVRFRFHNNKLLEDRFNNILADTDAFINPQHTPMGNQGKLKKRREYLSQRGKAYFSTTNAWENWGNLKNKKSLQYAYYDGKEIKPGLLKIGEDYILREYDITNLL